MEMNIPKKGPHKIPKLYQSWYEVAEHFKGRSWIRSRIGKFSGTQLFMCTTGTNAVS